MASLYEMMAAAEHKAQNKAAANPLQSGAAALAGGFTKGFDTRFGNESAADLKTKQFQQALLILKEEEQIQQLKRQALSDKVLRRQLVKAGYITAREHQEMENDDLGKGNVSNREMVGTDQSTLWDVVSGEGREVQQRGLVVEHKGDKMNVVQPKEKNVSRADQYDNDLRLFIEGKMTKEELKRRNPSKAISDPTKKDSLSEIDKAASTLPRDRTLPLNPEFQEAKNTIPTFIPGSTILNFALNRGKALSDKNTAALNNVTRNIIHNEIKTPHDLLDLVHEQERGVLPRSVDFGAILKAFGLTEEHINEIDYPPYVKTVSQALEYIIQNMR
jgi:hypothetical protein